MTDERKKKKDQPLTKAREVELGLRKKFHRQLFTKFAKAINAYDLLQEGDKVAVCISGGKDSMLLALLMQDLQRTGVSVGDNLLDRLVGDTVGRRLDGITHAAQDVDQRLAVLNAEFSG